MKVLYFCYENVFSTPILRSQVLAFLCEASRLDLDFRCTLMSVFRLGDLSPSYAKAKDDYVKDERFDLIECARSVSGGSSLVHFFWDFIRLCRQFLSVARSHDLIHCRSYVPTFIACLFRFYHRKPVVFDMRGVLPEELLLSGKIDKRSYKFRILKYFEKLMISRCDVVLTVSSAFSEYISDNFSARRVVTITCPTDRDRFNKALPLGGGDVVLTYAASNQPWHAVEVTLKYMAYVKGKIDNCKIRLFANDVKSFKLLADKLIGSDCSVEQVPFDLMPLELAKCDVAFCVSRLSLVSRVSCPVKFAEYLAAGLFVVVNEGVGDLAKVVSDTGAGFVLSSDSFIQEEADALVKSICDRRFDFNYEFPLEFDWGCVSQRLLAVYGELNGAHRRV